MKKSRLLLPILGIILLNVIFVSCTDNYKDLINIHKNNVASVNLNLMSNETN